ncbi:MAG: hypothetical protein RL076_1184 [Chloroflexota bacterium]|jgi:hypothetical protein
MAFGNSRIKHCNGGTYTRITGRIDGRCINDIGAPVKQQLARTINANTCNIGVCLQCSECGGINLHGNTWKDLEALGHPANVAPLTRQEFLLGMLNQCAPYRFCIGATGTLLDTCRIFERHDHGYKWRLRLRIHPHWHHADNQ